VSVARSVRRPGGLVARRGLFEVLDRSAPVVHVCGPAGSGKTSLIRGWIAEKNRSAGTAWVTIGVQERDSRRFWLAVLEAVRGTSAGSGLIADLTPAPGLDAGAIAERLLADLGALDERIWLVLDDLHELCSPEASRQLELFVMRAPDELRFVLVSRGELRLARLSLPIPS